MGTSSRQYLAMQQEQARRQRELPDTLDEAIRIIGQLHDDVLSSQQEIVRLHEQLHRAATWRAKLKEWTFSGIIGAIIGIVIGFLLQGL